MRLERLGPRHAEELLAGQDAELAREIIGRRWERAGLEAFLERSARWREDGPLCELAAVDADGALQGGGGLNAIAPGLERGQAALTYWVLARHRGRGIGRRIAAGIVREARSRGTVAELVLLIAPENRASCAIARELGAVPTDGPRRHPADPARSVRRWLLPLC
ncbi:GNAT family N-acetyltransferase [Brachybacterium sp. YJGR34]|uniref:GNAT family N-acetyltransferase n=1 Tax=Brachybacterium sp. YJGR34 TaxID=2059911 RepID=UPI000E0A4CD4|nr:GNAT family N-acetyltransferase [Brachybacterium sp. YJGR34]